MATTTIQLAFLMLFTNSCVAVWQNVTLMEGNTLTLSCPLVDGDTNSGEWQSPSGVMFYNHTKGLGLRDKRYRIEHLSSTKFTVSVTDVTFKDGGNYKCTHYGPVATEKVFAVTVLGLPMVTLFRQNRVKCSVSGNHYPPQISWRISEKVEIAAQPHYRYENLTKKYTSESMLSIKIIKVHKLCCVVRHKNLHTDPLEDCVKVRPASKRIPWKLSTRAPTVESQGSTGWLRSTTSWPETDQSATVALTATSLFQASPEATTPGNAMSSTGLHLDSMTPKSPQTTRSMADQSQGQTDSWGGTIPGTVVSTGLYPSTSVSHVPVTELTYENMTLDTSHNTTEGNSTQSYQQDDERLSGDQRNGSVLIFLVVCLIVSLSAVVVFMAIKLRRAHIHWKRENEDSDQSVESNKSKSSDEERWWSGQTFRGMFNIPFTKYVTEEPTGMSNGNTPTVEPVNVRSLETSLCHVRAFGDVAAPVKETEL